MSWQPGAGSCQLEDTANDAERYCIHTTRWYLVEYFYADGAEQHDGWKRVAVGNGQQPVRYDQRRSSNHQHRIADPHRRRSGPRRVQDCWWRPAKAWML
jgi:hypothetical protein